ncbi:hypothetical protein PM082_020728 [Marasmius tenuissimus]|nr:hypothetical protein PM082_020728 [Marasmius tenuissimus]
MNHSIWLDAPCALYGHDLSASQAQTAEVPNRSDLPPLSPPSDIDPGVFISHAIATAHAIAQAIMRPVSAPPIPCSPTRSFRGASPLGNNANAEVDPWVVAQNDRGIPLQITREQNQFNLQLPYIALSIRFRVQLPPIPTLATSVSYLTTLMQILDYTPQP